MVTKNHILAEIKRTAADNSGKPLGKGRFFAETGIKEKDWYGKYWVRWGDAVVEAGLAKNQMQSAFSHDHVLEKLAHFVRELGYYPVYGEIMLKARNDKAFPSMNVFKRFGPKTGVAAALIEFCQTRGGYDDVIGICQAVTKNSDVESDENSDESIEPGEVDFGFVYLLKSGKYFKIGLSNAVGRRERELAIQLPEKAAVVHSIKTDDPVGIESYWHRRFENKRLNGEWFDLSAADVAAFKRRKFM